MVMRMMVGVDGGGGGDDTAADDGGGIPILVVMMLITREAGKSRAGLGRAGAATTTCGVNTVVGSLGGDDMSG
jgi:hypothetical protein